MIVVKIKDSKTIRIYGENIGTKWNAFTIHARAQGKQPGRLLGEIFQRYYTDNLVQIGQDCDSYVNSELIAEE